MLCFDRQSNGPELAEERHEMPDVRNLVLAMSEDVQTHPLVLAAIKDASQWAKLDGFPGVPEYDATVAVIETVTS